MGSVTKSNLGSYLFGTEVTKFFPLYGKNYIGKIIESWFKDGERLFTVKYTDGDREDFNCKELNELGIYFDANDMLIVQLPSSTKSTPMRKQKSQKLDRPVSRHLIYATGQKKGYCKQKCDGGIGPCRHAKKLIRSMAPRLPLLSVVKSSAANPVRSNPSTPAVEELTGIAAEIAARKATEQKRKQKS